MEKIEDDVNFYHLLREALDGNGLQNALERTMLKEQATIFFTEVQQAFQFLVREYGYRHLEEVIRNAEYWPDATAVSRYVGVAVGIEVSWHFAGSYIGVAFIEVQQPYLFPEMYSFYPMNRPNVLKAISLYDLAEVCKRREDTDLLLKEVQNTRQINKQGKFIEGHLHEIVAGLARATQNCASDILKGDTSIFAEVMEYGLAKYRRLHPDGFLPGLRQEEKPTQEG